MTDYAYWDGASWSEPIDVFIGSRRRMALGASAVVDESGYLHTIWIDDLGLMYGKRHISSPAVSSSWIDRRAIVTEIGGNLHMPKLGIDGEGTLHVLILINGEHPGIYYLRSADSGLNWDGPLPISDLAITEWRDGRLRYQLDILPIDNVVHVVWQQLDQEGRGQIAYSRGVDHGRSWSLPITVQEGGSWPKLAAIDSDHLLLTSVGNDSSGRICMKRQSVSADMGELWSSMEIVFDPVRGCLGNSPIVSDGDGNAHQVMSAYDSTPIVERIWHTVWDQGEWDYPEELQWTNVSYTNRDLGNQPDFPSTAITGGNLLHVIFMSTEGNIWYTNRLLPSSSVQPIVYPIEGEKASTDSPFIESGEARSIELVGDSARLSPVQEMVPDEFSVVDDEAFTLDPYLIGLIASTLLITIVILLAVRNSRARR